MMSEIDPSEIQRAQEASSQEQQAPPAGAPLAPSQQPQVGQPSPPPPPPPPAPEGGLPPAAPAGAGQVASAPQPKVMPAEWPHPGYNGPQPWDQAVNNPPALTQNHLMLSAGMAGDEVVELAGLLAQLGYGTSISSGQNPHAIYDSGVADAVRTFCADYGAQEDPQVRAARTEDTVGPWLWEALTRAVHKKLAGLEG